MQATAKEARQPERSGGAQPAKPAEQPRSYSGFLEANEVTDPAKEVEYLLAAGWKFAPLVEASNPQKRWLDPESGKPARKVLVQPEQRDLAGRVTRDAVYQVYESVAPWYYPRREALEIQRGRDKEKKKHA